MIRCMALSVAVVLAGCAGEPPGGRPSDLPPRLAAGFDAWTRRDTPLYFFVSRDWRRFSAEYCDAAICRDDSKRTVNLARCARRLGEPCVIVGERGRWTYRGPLPQRTSAAPG